MTISTTAQLADRLHDIIPLVAAQASEADRTGVNADLIGQLRAAGLLEALEPRLRLTADRALARACTATAWLAAELGAGATIARAITGAPATGTTVMARHTDTARVEASRDGFIINGRWLAVGGVAHADMVLLAITGAEGDMLALVPGDALEIEAYHYLGGLRGVGWSHVTARDLAVSASHVASAKLLAASGAGANRLLGILVGCAEGGYDDYVRMTRARVAGIGGAAVANFTQVQARLAESHADMGMVTYLYEMILHDMGRPVDAATDSRIMRDRAFLGRKALDAVTRLVRQMGAMGLAETNPVQRRYRDLRTISADESFSWEAQLAQFGRRELGIGNEAVRTAA